MAGSDTHQRAFLGRARTRGFSVEGCRVLLAPYEDGARESAQVRAVATEHLARIDDRIAELQVMRRSLAHLIGACRGDHRPDCPILDDLAQGEEAA